MATPPPPEKLFPVSWDQFHRDSRALAWRLAEAGPFDAIVCITRGGLVAAAIYIRRKPTAESWIVAGFLLAAWGMLVWQIRGAYLATAFAIPFGAWAAARARQAWQASPSPLGLLMFVAVAATSAHSWSSR